MSIPPGTKASRPICAASARRQYHSTGGRCATDVTDAQYALIEPLPLAARRGGRRRGTSSREVPNALLYLLRTGCPPREPPARLPPCGTDDRRCRPWRMLPRGFPPRSTVHGCFRRLWQEGIRSTVQPPCSWRAARLRCRQGAPPRSTSRPMSLRRRRLRQGLSQRSPGALRTVGTSLAGSLAGITAGCSGRSAGTSREQADFVVARHGRLPYCTYDPDMGDPGREG